MYILAVLQYIQSSLRIVLLACLSGVLLLATKQVVQLQTPFCFLYVHIKMKERTDDFITGATEIIATLKLPHLVFDISFTIQFAIVS